MYQSRAHAPSAGAAAVVAAAAVASLAEAASALAYSASAAAPAFMVAKVPVMAAMLKAIGPPPLFFMAWFSKEFLTQAMKMKEIRAEMHP